MFLFGNKLTVPLSPPSGVLPIIVFIPTHSKYKRKGGSPLYIAQVMRSIADPGSGFRLLGGAMKLKLIFVVMELTIVVLYPFAFLAGKMRQILKFKR
jgi:hypothetical protein